MVPVELVSRATPPVAEVTVATARYGELPVAGAGASALATDIDANRRIPARVRTADGHLRLSRICPTDKGPVGKEMGAIGQGSTAAGDDRKPRCVVGGIVHAHAGSRAVNLQRGTTGDIETADRGDRRDEIRRSTVGDNKPGTRSVKGTSAVVIAGLTTRTGDGHVPLVDIDAAVDDCAAAILNLNSAAAVTIQSERERTGVGPARAAAVDGHGTTGAALRAQIGRIVETEPVETEPPEEMLIAPVPSSPM